MAIQQISRITHRKGVQENLPQLAVGEFGWSVDERRLYIGNGGSNAPSVENIEILTENSSIGETSSYIYADSDIGYTAQTGPSSSSPIVRTLQAKLDDRVSVRDYGAVGDGATDDTAAINRALTDLFVTQTFQATRRVLLFPAGTYIVQTSALKIPAYASIVGEGTRSSIIKRSDTTITSVMQTADSLNQIGTSIGTGGATRPSAITIRDMGFETAGDIDCFLVDQVNDIYFDNCLFKGNQTTLASSAGNGNAAVIIESQGTKISTNVKFTNCIFENHTYGVRIDDEVHSVVLHNCRFDNLFKGVLIGSEDSTTSPRGVKVIGCHFDNIYDRGIHVIDGTLVSMGNYFNDVGNSGAGSGSPATPVIHYAADNCFSLGDIFQRTDLDDASVERINNQGFADWSVDKSRVKYGRFEREVGGRLNMADTASAVTSTGLTFSDIDEPYVEIEYIIVRDNTVRNGLMRITHDASNQVLSDDYDENNGDTGVVFSISNASNVTTLNYLTSLGDATFTYSIRKLV